MAQNAGFVYDDDGGDIVTVKGSSRLQSDHVTSITKQMDISLSQAANQTHPQDSIRFESIQLEEPPQVVQAKQRIPVRTLHFSDGTLDVYDDDEDESQAKAKEPEQPPVDPKTLDWPDWFGFQAKRASTSTLTAMESAGEKLSWFFGITSPKYQYIIDEFNRRKEEEEQEKQRELREKEAQLQRHAQALADAESGAASTQSP